MIEIISGGLLSTVQDLGRFGVGKNGFTQSGAMDTYSMQLANKLCGNGLNCPVIEMTMLGITAKFKDEHIFAVCGGKFDIKLNNQPILPNKAYVAKANDILAIGTAKEGMRCYLAIRGGIKVPMVMGSASTNIKLKLGGYNGRSLKPNDTIEIGLSKSIPTQNRQLPEVEYKKLTNIRVVLGPQDEMFTKADLAFFLNQQYTVTNQLDRMGIRLNGIALKGKNGTDIISDGITFGAVQITRSGQPIILMADHQTTGGYAKIATVISVDLPLLAQVKPYDKICFTAISIKEAEKLAKKQKKFFEKLF
jgi:biotin-dependent carboxylase-like uncharacterized protein